VSQAFDSAFSATYKKMSHELLLHFGDSKDALEDASLRLLMRYAFMAQKDKCSLIFITYIVKSPMYVSVITLKIDKKCFHRQRIYFPSALASAAAARLPVVAKSLGDTM
jgi:hypothetical protein